MQAADLKTFPKLNPATNIFKFILKLLREKTTGESNLFCFMPPTLFAFFLKITFIILIKNKKKNENFG